MANFLNFCLAKACCKCKIDLSEDENDEIYEPPPDTFEDDSDEDYIPTTTRSAPKQMVSTDCFICKTKFDSLELLKEHLRKGHNSNHEDGGSKDLDLNSSQGQRSDIVNKVRCQYCSQDYR